MNLDQIASRIAAPDSSLGQEIPALKELTEKYPFAQVFSILYLKALSNQNAIGFEEALQKHAYRVTDRMKLYDLIHSFSNDSDTISDIGETDKDTMHRVSTEIQPLEITSSEIEQTEIHRPETANQEIVESLSIEQLPVESTAENIELPEDEIVSDQTGEIDEVEVIAEDRNIEEKTDSQEEVSVPEFAVDFIQDEVELEIISQVVANVYNDNLENSIPERQIEEKKSEDVPMEEPAEEKHLIETPRSFSSWLRAGNQAQETKTPELAKEAPASTEMIEKQIDKIIERFIEKEPSISRPKKEFYSPTKKAKESINPEGLIYTETLANIFAIQGNFPKAILAYEQLMLTNPEKKIFFALRIQELKEKLNT